MGMISKDVVAVRREFCSFMKGDGEIIAEI